MVRANSLEENGTKENREINTGKEQTKVVEKNKEKEVKEESKDKNKEQICTKQGNEVTSDTNKIKIIIIIITIPK